MTQADLFDGKTYNSRYDYKRLNAQLQRVFDLMIDGVWRTYEEISLQLEKRHAIHHPSNSIAARLRDFRKPKFGGYVPGSGGFKVYRRRKAAFSGLFEYQLLYVR